MRSISRFAFIFRRNVTVQSSRQYLRFQPDLDLIYRHASGNWLCNNQEHHDARTLTFNLPAFCEVAAEATGAGAVTDMLKISEDLNKVFLIRLDNGREAIAKFPTSLAGPRHFATASEVATIDFLQRRLDFPIPRVLAWSSRADSTRVGAEFILMEKAPGCLLSDTWGSLTSSEKGTFAKTLGRFSRQLVDLRFTHHGSLYYRNDISAEYRAPTLLEGLSPHDKLNSEFCIGPMARYDFWEAERECMNIDRGPWQTAEEYMAAVPAREVEWLVHFATPHLFDEPIRVLPGQGDREHHINGLVEYLDRIPFLVPPLEEERRPVLWYPGLHASDIFVNSSGRGDMSPASPLSVSSIVDWRGACIGPAFLQLTVPPLYSTGYIPPGRRLPVLVRKERKQRLHHKLFELAAFPRPIVDMQAREQRIHLDTVAQTTWKFGLMSLLTTLYDVYHGWDMIVPGETCPKKFSDEFEELFDLYILKWGEYIKTCQDVNSVLAIMDMSRATMTNSKRSRRHWRRRNRSTSMEGWMTRRG